ncbi:hypothetical protein [Mesorhizobium sp. SP-1A]|uniref:hypothetical protein n=1 Tax=Mesorhizobium sp. SP-1A TaxID=3077840 RepID=UPI0028F727DE|nr:hypothetical protein [Mesorhizobium sp. SP-1A]
MGEAKRRKELGLPPKTLKLTDEDKLALAARYGTARLAFMEWPAPFPEGHSYNHELAVRIEKDFKPGNWAMSRSAPNDIACLVARREQYEVKRYDLEPKVYDAMDELLTAHPDMIVLRRLDGLVTLVKVQTDVDRILQR